MGLNKKVLIIGGNSNLGKSFSIYLKNKKKKFIKTSRRKKSKIFMNLNKIEKFDIPKNISSAVIFAYQNNINVCEENYRKTYKVNVTNMVYLIKKLLIKKIFVLFISTNLVFNNSKKQRFENSLKAPVTNYGYMKSKCENEILQFCLKNNLRNYFSILRISKVLSPNLDPVKTWKRNFSKKTYTLVPTDIFCCPIDLKTLNKTIFNIVKNLYSGIYHLTGSKEYTYYDLAKKIFNDKKYFLPIHSKNLPKKIYNSKIKTFLSIGKSSKKIGIKKVPLTVIKRISLQ